MEDIGHHEGQVPHRLKALSLAVDYIGDKLIEHCDHDVHEVDDDDEEEFGRFEAYLAVTQMDNHPCRCSLRQRECHLMVPLEKKDRY